MQLIQVSLLCGDCWEMKPSMGSVHVGMQVNVQATSLNMYPIKIYVICICNAHNLLN